MRVKDSIRRHSGEGPGNGSRVVVMQSYGGPGLLLCKMGKHDSFMVSRDVGDETAVYWETCIRCGRLLSVVRFEGETK